MRVGGGVGISCTYLVFVETMTFDTQLGGEEHTVHEGLGDHLRDGKSSQIATSASGAI